MTGRFETPPIRFGLEPEIVVERGEEQRRRLAGDARRRQQDAGDHAGPRRPPGDLHDHRRHRRAERRARFAQGARHEAQHVLGGAHDHRDRDDGERDAAGPAGIAAHRLHHERVDEEADQDGGRREQDVVDEADDFGELRALAVFGEIGAGQNADRRRDDDAEEGQDQAADDGIGDAAALACRAPASSAVKTAGERPLMPSTSSISRIQPSTKAPRSGEQGADRSSGRGRPRDGCGARGPRSVCGVGATLVCESGVHGRLLARLDARDEEARQDEDGEGDEEQDAAERHQRVELQARWPR